MSGQRQKTFIVVALVVVVGQGMSGEQPRASATPCVQPGNRSPRLLPVDEASSIPEFFQYRARLQTTVERRDINALVEAADPAIRMGFYAEGAGALRKVFAEDPMLWDELRVVLANGGRFSMPTAFMAPYVYSNWPDRLDSFECVAVTGSNVRLRMAPRPDAVIVTSVTYPIVRLLAKTDDNMWAHVQLGDGRTGYIWDAYVRSPVNYRALFNLIDGRWRMTAFVSGD